MNSNDQIQKINLTTFKGRLIFGSFFVLMVPLLIITGCARYKDLPPGSVKEIRGSGFQGIDLAVLQRTSPFINQLASRPFVGGKIIQDGDIASGLTTEKQNEADKEFSILTPFGHDFFYNISNVLKPNLAGINGKDYAYVPRQYLIGPGDQIRVFFGSPLNKSYSLAVDEHGRVEIPGFGNVFVGGMKFPNWIWIFPWSPKKQ